MELAWNLPVPTGLEDSMHRCSALGLVGTAIALSIAPSCGGASDQEALFNHVGGASGADASAGQGGSAGEGGTIGQGGTGGAVDDAGEASAGSAGTAGQGGSAQGGAAGSSAGSGGTGASAGQGGSAGSPTIGTEFWAVDLPNERGGLSSDPTSWPSQKPWGVLVANHANAPAHVVVERNTAPLGSPASLQQVAAKDIAPGAVEQFTLPTQEVTGWTPSTTEPPGPPGTFLSSNAFRITSDLPVSVVQFNNLENVWSTDASSLLSRTALGTSYRVVGWPAANPFAMQGMNLAGIPDHTAVTIVGTTAGTAVKVTLGGAIVGDGAGINPTPAGGVVQTTLGPFDVLNLSSYGGTQDAPLKGDLTGTLVEASNPVAVFTSAERAMATAAMIAGMPTPPAYDPLSACCTEHLEEQLRPAAVAGASFVVAHSPWRSTGAYREPDLLRFVSLSAPAQVTTSLPAPFNQFSLQPGASFDAWTTTDAVISSTAPLLVAQVIASNTMTTDEIGDPSMLLLPPVTEYRTKYVFSVPTGWTTAGMSIATPQGNALSIDGASVGAQCESVSAGMVEGTAFDAMRCPVSTGSHVLSGSKPFGVSVFAYGPSSAWSYAASGE